MPHQWGSLVETLFFELKTQLWIVLERLQFIVQPIVWFVDGPATFSQFIVKFNWETYFMSIEMYGRLF